MDRSSIDRFEMNMIDPGKHSKTHQDRFWDTLRAEMGVDPGTLMRGPRIEARRRED